MMIVIRMTIKMMVRVVMVVIPKMKKIKKMGTALKTSVPMMITMIRM